ncbi:MAG: PBP1A family penicillin-binding protein [Candidatus Portnoybacteria bacterium]|nr:PBP1A family penicillin-binding protein [Candidatus Portnoybacteria bacterium]
MKRKGKGIFKKFLIFCFWSAIILFIFLVGLFAYFAKDLPNPEQIAERRVVESTKIYDRTGKFLLYDVHGEEKRTVIPFEEIPEYFKEATIIAEDDQFYHHFGLDFKGIIRAFLANFRGNRISQGGSTITQQFIKNAILSPEKTISRKIKEAILSIEMEIKYSKDEILGFYLNQVPYGSNAYGVEAAAQTFFNKNAKDLTLFESALLAALPKAPSYYSPYGSHFEDLKNRQEYILKRMKDFGYISQEQMEEAINAELDFSPVTSGIKAPHFVLYVKEYLENKYGQDYMKRAGLKVYTTLDWDLHQVARKIIEERVEKNIQNFRAHNAALVAIDPKTGQILTMIGSKDYFGESEPENCTPGKNCLFEPNVNVAIRERQPGSSFKPFAYTAALMKGFTPETVVFDLQTNFGTDENNYTPKNYDLSFRGPVTLRKSLAQSLNVPSVKTLYLAGLDETINIAQDMGIETLKNRSRYGLSLVLGGGEVKLLEETGAFGVFANNGVKNPITSILKIEDGNGNVLEEFKYNPKEVIDPQITSIISDILSDEESRAPAFGSKSKLYLEDRPVAAKTGTTQEYRDGWTVGYTPSLAVGVWAGNNDNTSMRGGAGIYVAAPIWNEFIKKAYDLKINDKEDDEELSNYFDLPDKVENFPDFEPIETEKGILNGEYVNQIKVKVNKLNGKLITEDTPSDLIEERVYSQVHCILYYLDKDDPQGDGNGINDPQFNNWEIPVLNWAEQRGFNNQEPPTEYDDSDNIEVEISNLEDGDKININEDYILIKADTRGGIEKVKIFFDDNLIKTDYSYPYYSRFKIPSNIKEGEYLIRVEAFSKSGDYDSDEIIVEIID